MRIRTVVAFAIVSTIACTQAKPPPVVANRPPQIEATSCLADKLPALHYAWKRRPDCTTADDARCMKDCSEGDVSACFERAIYLEQSIDPERGRELFVRACLMGLSIACVNHAAGLWARPKTRADLVCARQIFEKACAAKDSMGCGMVGRMLVEGAKTDEARVHARNYLERLCNELEGPTCRMLAFYLEGGKLGAFEPALLEELMAKACSGGDPLACGDHATVRETFNGPKP